MRFFTGIQLSEFQQYLEKGFPFKDKQKVKQGIQSAEVVEPYDGHKIDPDGNRFRKDKYGCRVIKCGRKKNSPCRPDSLQVSVVR